MPPVKLFRESFNRGCRLHNRYMWRTGLFGHYENHLSSHYSKDGARAAERSVVAYPEALPGDAWLDSVYHRIALMQPRMRSSGYAASHGFTCLRVFGGISDAPRARAERPVYFAWPHDGAQNQPPSFGGNEWPDPLLDAPGADRLGTPITFAVNGPWKHWSMVESHVDHAWMIDDAGVPVAVSVSDAESENGGFLQGGFALLPRRTLTPYTGYGAGASGTVTYRGRSWPFQASTRFRTGAADD